MRWNNMEMKSEIWGEGGGAGVRKCIKPNLERTSPVGCPKIKFAQNYLKHNSVLEFLKSEERWEETIWRWRVRYGGRGVNGGRAGVRKCIKPNLDRTSPVGCPKIKFAQNYLKHISVLEFLKSVLKLKLKWTQKNMFFLDPESKYERIFEFETMFLSCLFKELLLFENCKMYRNVLKNKKLFENWIIIFL